MPSFLGTVLEVYPFVPIKDSSSKGSECGGKSPRQSVISLASLGTLVREGRAKSLPLLPLFW